MNVDFGIKDLPVTSTGSRQIKRARMRAEISTPKTVTGIKRLLTQDELKPVSEKLSYKPYLLASVVLTCLWALVASCTAVSFVEQRAINAYKDAAEMVSSDLKDSHLGLERNLRVLHSFPAAVGRIDSVGELLDGFVANPLNKALTPKQAQWAIAGSAHEINRSLSEIVGEMQAMSVIWLISTNGRAVASSNASAADSFVGTDYSDREYFKQAMGGQLGQQFALGRVSNVPGLFFSAPVRSHGKIVGVVAGKLNLEFLSHWTSQANAFVSDENGVIIHSKDPSLQMKALPGAPALVMPADYLMGRYKQDQFETLLMKPFNAKNQDGLVFRLINAFFNVSDLPQLLMIDGKPVPYLLASKPIAGEQLRITTMQPVPLTATLWRDMSILAFSLIVFGGLLIAGVANVVYYVLDRQHARRNRARRELTEHLASHDELTGLYSRRPINGLIERAIKGTDKSGRDSAVLWIDLDLFKEINDSMGHEAGDQVLKAFADRLKSLVRGTDSVIRYGGDEFIVILKEVTSNGNAAVIAEKILRAVQEPFEVQDEVVKISASIGIAMYPSDGATPSVLLNNADIAMYKAKESGRASYRFYHPSLSEAITEQRLLESELRHGLERGEFEIYYQPQFSNLTQGIIGFEALIRWNHPVKGLVSPAKFIPAAEKSGLIVQMGEWTIQEACRQAAAWKQMFGRDITIAVNLSAVHFRQNNLQAVVKAALQKNNLFGNSLELEITESLMMHDTDEAVRTIKALKELGVKFSIDDFGTGYSSLSYLRKFPVDSLKIDQSFVRDMATSQIDRDLIRTIITMANSLGLHVIAEGVETDEQRLLLNGMSCHSIQGYLIERPMPAAKATDFLVERYSTKPINDELAKLDLQLVA